MMFSGYNGNIRFEVPMGGVTRNLTIAMLVRNRRQWSANVPNVVAAGPFLFSVTTSDGNNPGVWINQNTTGVSGYKLYAFGSTSHVQSGTINDVCSALPVDWTFIALTIDSQGRAYSWENGRKQLLSGNVVRSVITKLCIGRTTQGVTEPEVAKFAAWQSVPSDATMKSLKDSWLADMGTFREPTTSVSVTGDSIIAGETYVVSTSWESQSICERLHLRDRRLRIYDVSKSSTLFADGVSYMTNATASDALAKGGLGFHSSYYSRKIHVLQHGRNDLSTGADLATMRTRCAAAVAQVKAYDSTILVGLGTVIATVFSASAAYPDQNAFDQGCIDWNNDVRTNAATLGHDFVIDWGADSAFAPVVGTTPYTNTLYYAGDNIHPNGNAGADLMTTILLRDMRPYIL